MEHKTGSSEESHRKLGERIQQRSDCVASTKSKYPATSSANLSAHLEAFAKAVAEGSSHVRAAEICGRKRGSASFLYAQPGVQERIAELQMIAKNATEKAVTENAIRMRRVVDIDRNEIVMLLADLARSENEPGAVRVRALNVLSRIFMLQARTLKDLEEFYGWFSDEMEDYAETGQVPVRLRPFMGEGETEAAS